MVFPICLCIYAGALETFSTQKETQKVKAVSCGERGEYKELYKYVSFSAQGASVLKTLALSWIYTGVAEISLQSTVLLNVCRKSEKEHPQNILEF